MNNSAHICTIAVPDHVKAAKKREEDAFKHVVTVIVGAVVSIFFALMLKWYWYNEKKVARWKWPSIAMTGALAVLLFAPENLGLLWTIAIVSHISFTVATYRFIRQMKHAKANFPFYTNLSESGERISYLAIEHIYDITIPLLNFAVANMAAVNAFGKPVFTYKLTISMKGVLLVLVVTKAMLATPMESKIFGRKTDGGLRRMKTRPDIPSRVFDVVLEDSDSKLDGSVRRGFGSAYPSGLINEGNTCYLNSLIQCFAYSPELLDYFRNQFFEEIKWQDHSTNTGSLVIAFHGLLLELWTRQNAVAPRVFKTKLECYAPNYIGSESHDIQALFDDLLNGLHDGLKRPAQPFSVGNSSIILDIFQGQYKSTLVCTTCQKKSECISPFSSLSLPLRSSSTQTMDDEAISLSSCLEAFFHENLVTWNCPQCKEPRIANKKLHLWKLPKILVIHLLRFKSNGSSTRKLCTSVLFPLQELNLTGYVPDARTSEKTYYELYALANHYGGMETGHYTAHVKLLNENMWYKFDDSQVSPINEETVSSNAAYVLFYRTSRTDMEPARNGTVNFPSCSSLPLDTNSFRERSSNREGSPIGTEIWNNCSSLPLDTVSFRERSGSGEE